MVTQSPAAPGLTEGREAHQAFLCPGDLAGSGSKAPQARQQAGEPRPSIPYLPCPWPESQAAPQLAITCLAP